MRIPLMLFSLEKAKTTARRFRGIGRLFKFLSPSLDTDLMRAEIDLQADQYRIISVLSALFFAFIFSFLISILLFIFTQALRPSILLGFLVGIGFFFMIFLILLRYPKIIAGKEAEQIDKDLVYALKDLLLSISSGLPMFTALTLVSKGSYGYVSKDIKRVVDKVNTGVPLEDALEKLAISTPSESFQNALWQIINTSRSGADIEGVIRSLIQNLVSEQKSNIEKYSNELNVLTLVYMLVAVAIPTIIVTLMIILNAFASAGINEMLFIVFVVMSAVIQLVIIGMIKSRRPVVRT
jgi:pilus assembly protein TadC